VVSGSGINACGHLLLHVDNRYYHIGRIHSHPLTMNQFEYERYLKENRKTEIYRKRIYIKNKTAASNKLNESLKKRWLWGGIPNNCVSFVEEIAKAGGSNFGLLTNCPVMIGE
jgi:hypothetical protein